MQTMQSHTGFIYYGEREGWLVAAVQAPDYGDTVQRSNFRSILRALGGVSDDVAIEYAGGAVGKVDYILVRPDSPAAEAAEALYADLEDYPVVDDEDLSQLEFDEEWCVRCDGATREQHPTVRCGKFRSAEDANELRHRWTERDHARRWQSQ